MPYLSSVKVKGTQYYSIYEGYREGGKVKHRILVYLGNTEKVLKDFATKIGSIEDIAVEQVLDCGTILPFHQLYADLGLREKINALMPKEKGTGIDVGRLIEVLVLNALLAHRSKEGITKWYRTTILPKLLDIKPDQLYSQLFCRALDYFTEGTIMHLEKQLTTELQTRFNFEIKTVFYDITSIYLEGDQCPLGEFGYSRDGKRHNKQIVFGLAVVPHKTFPILYRVYKGNTADVKTSEEVIQQLFQLYGIQDSVVIVDRGMISDEVRLQFHDLKVRYISALEGSSIEAKDLILGTLRNLLRPLTLRNGRQVFIKRRMGSIKALRSELGLKPRKRKENKELDDIPFLYLIGKSPEFSQAMKDAHYEALAEALQAIKEFQEELNSKTSSFKKKGRPIDIDGRLKQILHGVTRYFQYSWEKVGTHIQVSIKFHQENLRIARKTKGKFVLCASDPSLTNRQMVQGYIDKYQIEQAFRVLKSDLHIRPIGHRKTNRVIAALFISYLAYLLKTMMDYQFKQSHLHASFKEALDDLRNLKIVTFQLGGQIYEKHPEISSSQQKIFKSLKVNLSD